VYGKSPETIMKEDAIRAGRLPWLELTREIQPELRNMVLERDNNQCVKCGNKENLQCHHILPAATDPIESADMDNCITLCKDCHKEVHQQDGCRYGQLRICIEYGKE
jgi:5-methylcytosine-specific restriction endonuclease McrA